MKRLVLALVLGASAVEAAAPPGPAFFIELPPEALPVEQGANGFVVGGTFASGGAFHWMPSSGVTPIGGTQATSVSNDGKTIIGRAWNAAGFEEAAIWTGGRTWRLLGSVGAQRPCDLLVSGAFGANDDGRVVVGLAWDGCAYARAFRWEESTGMVDLGSLNGESTRANGVSGDGRVVVGWQEAKDGFRQGAKWVDGKQELISGPSGFVGEAFDANRDGSLIVGANCDPMNVGLGPTGWTWTPGDGLRCFPVTRPAWAIPRHYQAYMTDTNDDGRVIGGTLSFGLDAESLVWFDGEPVFLRDYLRDHGVPDAFRGWVNTGFITGVSSDGRTLVGYGAGPRAFQGFVVLLPELADK